ncbi:MAG: hypothetical protein KDB20_04805 [Microthrixaceae bacterium]|nr:hypothetical protein [Microthrixaceae bacterium]
MIVDAGPLIVDGENLNSRLWALVRQCIRRGDDVSTTHPVLAQVWRQPQRQANLARLIRQMDTYGLTDSRTVGRKLADSDTSDVVDAHLAVIAERLGTFILTTDAEDMARLDARFERY